MVFFLLAIVGLIIYKSEWHVKDFNKEYLNKDICNAVKGVFILVVFYRHFSQYVSLDNQLDKPFVWINSHISQLLVAMFLFYSGYGVAFSIEKKGLLYIKDMPLKRAFITLLNFDIAVLCYMLLGYVMGKRYEKSTILLSFIGWKSVGNSNWYIYVIVSLYILVWISYVLFYGYKRINVLGGGTCNIFYGIMFGIYFILGIIPGKLFL